MQYSKTTLMELSHKYCSILKKCALLNTALLMGSMIALPVGAAETIDAGQNKTVENQTISDQSSDEDGGVFYNKGTLEIDNVVFSQNNADIPNKMYGGAIFSTGTSLVIENSTFSGNTAFAGGAVYESKHSSGKMEISNTEFSNNQAITDAGALGIFKEAELDNVQFYNNSIVEQLNGITAANSDGGGAIQIGGTANASLNDVIFKGNTSVKRGGAIAARHGVGYHVSISNSLFDTNSSGNFGGAVATVYGGQVTIESVDFINNSAQKKGGAIFNGIDKNYGVEGGVDSTNHGGIKISGENRFVGNSAGEYGGAIYSDGGVITLSGTNVFSGNTAAGKANDIHNLGTLNISGNLTLDGGITGDGTVNFTGATNLTARLKSTASILGTAKGLDDVTVVGLVVENGLKDGSYALFEKGEGTFDITATNALYDFTAKANGYIDIAKKSTSEVVASLTTEGVTVQEAAALSAIAGTTSDSPLLAAISTAVQSGNVGEAVQAAKDLAPTTSQQVLGVTKDVVSMLSNVASDRINPVGLAGGDVFEGFGMWAQGLYNRSKQDATASSEGFRANTRGIAVGLDGKLSKAMTVGIGYGYTDTDADAGARDVDVEGHHVFLYGQYKPSQWYANWLLDYGYAKYDETKTPAGLSIKTSYNVHSYAAHYMTGYDFENGLMTEVGARYLLVDQDAYNDGVQRIKSDKNDTLTAVAGVKYQAVVKTDDVTFVPRLRLAATYDVKSDASEANVQVVGGGNYQITGERLHRFGVEAGVGVTATVGAWDVSLDYFGGYRKDYQSHTGLLKAQYNF